VIGGVFRHGAISIGGRCVGRELLQEKLEEKELTTEKKKFSLMRKFIIFLIMIYS